MCSILLYIIMNIDETSDLVKINCVIIIYQCSIFHSIFIAMCASFSFICFLRKMEKWLEMNQNAIPREFKERIKSLERSFCVCTPIFKKFCPLFQTVFMNPFDPVYTPTKHKRRHR